jgi:hypothetical protein
MFDVFWVYQVLLLRVLVVVFFEMVDFVFIFIIAVVSRSQPGIWQLLARAHAIEPLVARDDATIGSIEDLEDVEDGFVLDVGRGGLERFVV